MPVSANVLKERKNMDREKLRELLELINDIVGEDGERCPLPEDLNYDEDAIRLYDDIVELKNSLEELGF